MSSPEAPWADVHCHLHEFEAGPDREHMLERALAAGCGRFHVNGTHPGDWSAVAALANRPEIHPHFGLHPWFADRTDDWQAPLRALLLRFPSAGLGEIGLDSRLTPVPLDLQLAVLHEQLALASELQRPCTLHAVGEVHTLLLRAVQEHRPPAVLLHAWNGGTRDLAAWLDGNAYFSVGGTLLRPTAFRKLAETLRAIPPDRLLLESDAPWQHPRGRRNRSEPALIPVIAETAADVLGMPLPRLRSLCQDNHERWIRSAVT